MLKEKWHDLDFKKCFLGSFKKNKIMGYREIPCDFILMNTKTISAKHAEDKLQHKVFFVKENSTDDTS